MLVIREKICCIITNAYVNNSYQLLSYITAPSRFMVQISYAKNSSPLKISRPTVST